MRMNLKRFIKSVTIWPAALIFIIFIGSSTAFSATAYSKFSNQHNINSQDIRLFKILSVLENRTGDHELLEKAKDKLSTLSDNEIRLISSLCDRISNDSNAASADIAFSLVTALIILS